MLRNYFKIAWRNLFRNKTSSFINISGLSIGMAIAMLIACWIYNEWSYNHQFENYKRITQVWQLWSGGKGAQWQLPAVTADELRLNYAGNFKRVVLSSQKIDCILANGEKKLIKAGNFIEPAGIEMLSLPMLQGTRAGLDDPRSIFLSASLAKALFGNADPMGKVLSMDDSLSLKVTGVYKDFPLNSSFSDITFLSPWKLYEYFDPETRYNRLSWGDNNWKVYAELADHADIDKVSAAIKTIKANKDPFLDSTGHNINTTQLFLHPMDRWHLYSDFKEGNSDTGRIMYVRLFGWIGAFVLLLACINFMNLSTARSEKRAREVGIRKTIGSLRSQLIGQFFMESLLVAMLSLVFALTLVLLALPFFNELADAKVMIPWASPVWWMACIGFSVFTGLLAGSYPAFYLSSFQPVKVLKGTLRMGSMAVLPRKILVVLQFTVSIVMIIGTVVVFRQVQYGKDRPVGYQRKSLVMLQAHTTDIHDHFDAFRNDLINTGAVSEVAESVSPVTASWPFNGGLKWTGHDHWDGEPDFSMKGVTQEYLKTIGLEFIKGRDFRTGPDGADAKTMIVNETTAKYLKVKDPVGITITWQGTNFTVIGVVKDMVMESPYETQVAAIFYLAGYTLPHITFRINPKLNAHEALNRISPVFTKYSPAEPFDYKFADQEYEAKFRSELKVGQLSGFFTILAIFISCLGLFGMASFVAEQRVKEIGVRKVLGATVFNLWQLLSKDFVLLVIISLVIASPLAFYFMHSWLQNYQYRSPISWWIFMAAGAGAIVLTILTISFQTIKAATANPVKSLRME